MNPQPFASRFANENASLYFLTAEIQKIMPYFPYIR